MRRHVFVSHASGEHATAEALCRSLEAEGLPCWIAPRDIPPGADWAEQIIDGIDSAWAVLLVLGAAANRSQQVRREVERAVHKDVPVLALRVEDLALSKSLEYFLSAQHWIDAFGGPAPEHRARLVRALRVLRDDGASADGASAPAPAPAAAAPGPTSAVPVHAPVPVPTLASSASPPPTWDAASLEPITERLAQALGPVAALLVARAARAARSEAEMLEMLAREIDDPRSRDAFVSASRRR